MKRDLGRNQCPIKERRKEMNNMKKVYLLLGIIGITLLFGCSEETMKEDKIERDKIEKTDINIAGEKEDKENFKVPFKIEAIDSKILDLNDAASDTPLIGVRYEISLFSKEKMTHEVFSSYTFEIVAKSTSLKSLGPIQSLSLANTLSDGYLYNLSFETEYRDYTQEELESLLNDRDFQVIVVYEGGSYPVEYQ